MKAIDVMTSRVISVNPETPVRDIAILLFENHISGVPVLDKGRLVGMVSEADLLHRQEIGTDGGRGGWWRRLFTFDNAMEDYIKSHGVKARDVMSRDVVSVAEDTPLAEIATILETRGFKRVPVLRGEKLVGIVSRSNLVRALAAAAAQGATEKTDDAIRRRLLDELGRQSWWRDTSSNVVVDGGVVHYSGLVYSDRERAAARVAAERVAGVRRVEDHRLSARYLPESV
jgi:CBS domain-containing protein